MKRLKVLLVNDAFYPSIDGVLSVMMNQAKLIAKNHDIAFLVPTGKGNKTYFENKENYKIFYVPTFWGPMGYRATMSYKNNEITKALDEFKPDIIHIYAPFKIARFIVKYAKKRNIPTLMTIHSQYKLDFVRLFGKYNPLVKIMVAYTDSPIKKSFKIDCVNKLFANDLEKKYKKTLGLENNATNMRFPANPDELIKKVNDLYYLSKEQNILLFVGRIVSYKNVFFIVDVIEKLKNKNVDFKMVFVGGGPETEKLKKYINKHNVADRCILLGQITDKSILQAIMLRSDLFIFPSKYDVSPIVKIEAACMKLPLITTENTYSSYMIEDGFNGYISKDDVNAYADKVESILSDKQKLKLVGENAQKTIYKHWDDQEQDIINNYLKVIDEYSQNKK